MQLKFKKTVILVLHLLIVGQLQAQNIVPIEKQTDYIESDNRVPDGTYFKDVNNLLDPLVGTWKGSMDNKIYYFYVTKITISSYGITFDKLDVRHLIVDNSNGTILENSMNSSKLYISADYYRKEYASYQLNYWGVNYHCGQQGYIHLKSLSPTSMEFSYSRYLEGSYRKEECPGGKYTYAFFPESVDLILTKQ